MTTTPGSSTLRKIDAMALGLGLAAAAGAYFLAIEPALRTRREHMAKLEALGPQEVLRDQSSFALSRAIDRRKDAERELNALPLRLEPASQINHRLVRITEMAADSGLSLDQFTPGVPTVGPEAVVVPLRLVGRGDFPAALRFLSRLHADFGDTAVSGFRLSGNVEASDVPGAFVFDLSWHAASEGPQADRQAGVPLP